MKKVIAIVLVVGLIFIQSCGSDDATCTKVVPAASLASVDQVRLASDITAIDTYLANNGITAQSEPNGVRYVITTQGSGATPCLESRLTVKYKGNLLSDPSLPPFDERTTSIKFQSSLSNLILGWQLVLPAYAPEGTKVTLYIPSGYGYGASVAADGKIPANANLIFEIELISVL